MKNEKTAILTLFNSIKTIFNPKAEKYLWARKAITCMSIYTTA